MFSIARHRHRARPTGTAPLRLLAGIASLAVAFGVLSSAALAAPSHKGPWAPALPSVGSTAVATDPGAPMNVYALGGAGAFYRSTDGGSNWSPNATSGDDGANVIAPHPANPNRIYIGTGKSALQVSDDGGLTWGPTPGGELASGDPALSAIRSIVIAPSNPDIAYAGISEGSADPPAGVFKTEDGGATWDQVSAGLTDTKINALAVSRTNPAVAYAATDSGLFATADGGASWAPTPLTAPITALAMAPSGAETLYAGQFGIGVHRSSDGGATWQLSVTGMFNLDVRSLAVDPAVPDAIYMGGLNAGVFRSFDRGQTWKSLGEELLRRDVVGLAADPLIDGGIYAATPDGIFHFRPEIEVPAGGGTPGLTLAPIPPSIASDDACKKVPKRRTNGGGGKVRVSSAAMKIQQNQISVAILRLNAINARARGGFFARDLCGFSFGAEDFSNAVKWAGGANNAAAPANPRRMKFPKFRKKGAKFQTTKRQAAINDTLANFVLAKALATRKRYNALGGGDLRAKAVTSGKLHNGLQVVSGAGAGGVGPRSTLPKFTWKKTRASQIRTLNAAYLLRTQRKSQRAIRILNQITDEIHGGLKGKNFRNKQAPGSKLG